MQVHEIFTSTFSLFLRVFPLYAQMCVAPTGTDETTEKDNERLYLMQLMVVQVWAALKTFDIAP